MATESAVLVNASVKYIRTRRGQKYFLAVKTFTSKVSHKNAQVAPLSQQAVYKKLLLQLYTTSNGVINQHRRNATYRTVTLAIDARKSVQP